MIMMMIVLVVRGSAVARVARGVRLASQGADLRCVASVVGQRATVQPLLLVLVMRRVLMLL